ncbi:MAG: MFS transporter [Polyangiaceae bacterium]|jgi:MFS family permease
MRRPLSAPERAARAAALAIAPGVLLAGVGGGMAFPILPLVGLRAGLSLPAIGVILAANRFGRVLINPVVGGAVDRVGAKGLLVVGLITQVFVLGLYLAGVVSGHPGTFFLLGRLLHGPSSSCVFIAGQTLALHAGGRDHKGLASGIVRSAMSAGMPAGLVVGGLLAGWIGPAATFAVAMVAPIAAAGVAAWTVPDLRAPAQRAPTLREVVRSLRSRAVAAVAAINFVSTFSALGVILTTLVLIIHERGIAVGQLSDQTSAGIFMGFLVIFMTFMAPLAGRLSDRRGWRARVVMGGIVVMVPGVLLIGLAASAAPLAAGLVLVGLGMGALTSPLLALIGDLVPSDMRGSAVGCLQLFGDAGGVLGPIVGTSLIGGAGRPAYVATAVLLALTLPLGGWLAAAERVHVSSA